VKLTGPTTGEILAIALVLTIFGWIGLAGCASGTSDPRQPAVPTGGAPSTEDRIVPAESHTESNAPAAAIERLLVMIYYPALEAEGLIGEVHEIFNTAAPGDRAKQIVADLISGPTTDLALRAIPPGTRLRQIFVLEGGIAFVDFSKDLEQAIAGGSTHELLAVYSIVNSLVLNIPDIRRVGILINGRPVETLNGHLDLRRPLPPDTSYISDELSLTIVQNLSDRDETVRGATGERSSHRRHRFGSG